MKTHQHTKNGFFYSLGKCLGLPLAWVLRLQKPLINWLTSNGFTVKAARGLLICVNLLVFSALLFIIVPLHIIMLIVALIAIAYKGVNVDLKYPENRYEQRAGTNGYGLYDNELGFRVDAGSIEDEY